MLNLAGVVCRRFLVNTELHKQLAQNGMALVGALGDLQSRFG